MHGTPEENVDSILKDGLHGGTRSPPRSWFTSDYAKASEFAKGALRWIVFLVLHSKNNLEPIVTSALEELCCVSLDSRLTHAFVVDDHTHHLPAFVLG